MQRKTIAIPLLAAMLFAGASWAERPQGPPGDRAGQDGPRRGGKPFGDRERGGPPWQNEEISDALRLEVEAFWKDAAPNRWEAYEKIEDPEKKKHVFGFMLGYYRGLGWIKHDEELFKARKKQIGIEDNIFAIQRKYKDVLGDDSKDPRYAEAQAELEKPTRDLWDAVMAEKGLRVQRLEKHFTEEKAKLAADTADRDKQIKEMLDRLMKGKPPLPPPGMRGPDGRGDDRRGDRNGREKPDRGKDKKDDEKKERE
jgi:hypothetical protein